MIICLARDSSPRNKGGVSPSALFISYDYGKNFTNKTESFRLGDTPDSGYAQLDKFFNHPKFPEFVSIFFLLLSLETPKFEVNNALFVKEPALRFTLVG